jgi:hypothetical protein
MEQLLSVPDSRPREFRRGSQRFDPQTLGYLDEGTFLFKSTGQGNSVLGHAYGSSLSKAERSELVEYLKSL